MSSQDNDQLTGHEYDGIREYDNPLPNWWLMTFFGTVIFAFIYWLHYEVGGGPSLKAELNQAMLALQAHKQQAVVKELSEADLETMLKDPQMAAAGALAFTGKCAACHGPELQGGIGPNLTDAFWLHGKGTREDIMHTIQKGVPDKGMPPWESMLSQNEILSLTALIVSKQDTNPAGAKPPQGEKVR